MSPLDPRLLNPQGDYAELAVTSNFSFLRGASHPKALVLTALLRGEDHARGVQLGLEYNPAPPFDAGTPAKAGEALVSAFEARMERAAPGRHEELRDLAATRGFRS